MARKKSSDAVFWMKHLGLMLAAVVIAAVVVGLQNINLTTPVPEGAEKPKSLSEGMSRFYATHRMSSSKPFEEDMGDFVMALNTPEEPLDDRLKSMESMQKPVSRRWVGDYKHRSFNAGSTMREAITAYAQQEGMQVLWELDKDFIIKHQFQLDGTVASSLGKIVSSINPSFEGEVRAYLCPKQRSLVVTESQVAYLKTHCSVIRS